MAYTREEKNEWQRQSRKRFVDLHGYSSASHYANGKIRHFVLARDEYRCVKCGMTDVEHKEKWKRPITVDHKDKNKKNNTMENLQTLCLRCHGQKDITPRLKVQRVPPHKALILELRADGRSYQSIGDQLGFSIAAIWKWCKKWDSTSTQGEKSE